MHQATPAFSAKRLLLFGLYLFVLGWIESPAPWGLTQPLLSADQPGAIPHIACNQVTEIPEAECNALQTFYTATGGAGWTTRTGWTDTLTPCSWYGVTCVGGRVSRLTLGGNNLTGALPADLRFLTQLTELDLHINQLSGFIPQELAELTQLTELRLSDNQLSGTIPKELGALPKVRSLKLNTNQLRGPIPPELGNLTTLIDLILNTNNLTGTIPASLGALPNLQVLFLYDNRLSGPIPAELGNLSNLYSLGLNINQLTGPIPATLGNFTNLNRLALANNQLNGSLPPDLGKLTTLDRLEVNSNSLSGSLPLTLTNLTSLTTFYFQNTELCVPQQPAFLSWLNGIPNKTPSGKDCPLETPTATATATATPTATPTATATPSATPTATATATATPTTTPTSTPGGAEEPNDLCDQARPITADGVAHAYAFQTAADRDWVRFVATANTRYRIEVEIPYGSPADVNLELYADCGALALEQWHKTFTPGVRLTFQAPASGSFYLRLENVDATVYGAQVTYQLSVRALSEERQVGAAIIVAGRLRGGDQLQPNIHNVTDAVYKLFQANGYTNDDIYYLATDSTLPGYDAAATAANLQAAITSWAAPRVGPERALTLYMMDHGGIGKFYLDDLNQEYLTPTQLNDWLTQLENQVPGVKVNLILEACHAGSFIRTTPSPSKAGRIIVASTNVENDAYASRYGAHFSDQFLVALSQGINLYSSFWHARTTVNRLYSLQDPWLDADGDQIPNELEDASLAAERGFGQSGTFDSVWPPFIVHAQQPVTITDGRGVIEVEVRDNEAVASVWAVIYPPSYQPAQSGEELVAEALDTILLQPQGADRYRAAYAGFQEHGRYRVVIHAEDAQKLEAQPLLLDVYNGSQLFLPLITAETLD